MSPDGAVDAETMLADLPPGRRDEMRLWLRLFACARLIEAEVSRRLRARFATTLPRFDLLAQLERAPEGLTAAALSRRLMVTGGNVTGLAARLLEEGLIERRPMRHDRRAAVLRLSPAGRREFSRQSAAHGAWIAELLGGLGSGERADLLRLLDRARAGARAAIAAEETT